jgi:two-component system, chemotaxis family, response regulator Rcp1
MDNGEQALQFIDAADQGMEQRPTLLILDLNLPRRTGREVLKHLRKSKTCADVPVLIVTSSSVDQVEMEGLGEATIFESRPITTSS